MKKILKTSVPIVDAATLAELNLLLSPELQKAANDGDRPRNGFWAYASVEKPDGDSDGDIIEVAGIECAISASDQCYLPLLPGHQRKLASGHAAEIGRIEMTQKTKCKDMSALAMYFTFALKDDGEPMDDLVKGYYERYKAGYCNAFSVGMEATAEPVKIPGKGFRFPKTKLYEVSMVSIGANDAAIPITRGSDDEVLTLLKSQATMLKLMEKRIGDMADDIDVLSTVMATQTPPTPKPIKAAPTPDPLTEGLLGLANKFK